LRLGAPGRADVDQWWPIAAVGVAAVGAAVLVWWATAPWGAGLSPDAIAYSAIAERIRDHGAVGYWLEPSTSSWPPLFPALLAGLSAITKASVVDTGRWLNGLLQGATVIVVAALAWRLLRSTWLRALAVLVAVLAQPLVHVATKVWSEPLFNLFVLSAALVLSGVPGSRPRTRIAGASALVVGAFMTRYAGLAFVPAGAAVVALWPRATPRAQRLLRATWFAVPAFVSALALVAWNRARTGNVFGPRWRPDEPFWNHAADGAAAIGQWFLPSGSARTMGILVSVLVFATVVTVLVFAGRETRSIVGPAPVLAVFVLCYSGYMVWARTTSGFDPLNSRLMLPIVLPAVLLVLSLVERGSTAVGRDLARGVVLALPAVLLLPLALNGVDTLRTSHDVGNEYTNAAVRQFVASPILRQVPDDCALVSNDPWLLWLAGFEAQLSPESDREVAIPQSMTLDEFTALASSQSICLVWLDTGSTVFYTPKELADVVRAQPIASDDFATIYRVSAPA
jgi:hypothetical protein